MSQSVYLQAIFSVLLCYPSTCFADIKDSVIYRTPFERKTLERIQRNEPTDQLAALIAFDGDSTDLLRVKDELGKFYGELNPKLKKKDERETVKIIFNQVHERFLTKYVDSASFLTAFYKHSYSCVSGSAMYGIVLSHYNIPFEIREKPGHVNVVAWPQTLSILLEATDPKGFIDPRPEFKERQINRLLNDNMLSQEYVSRVGVAKAFNTFFFSQNGITLTNLAGIQYLNGAFRAGEQSKNIAALQLLSLASILYPTPKNSFYRKHELEQIIVDGSPEKIETFKYMVLYTNEYPNEAANVKAENYFERVMTEYLVKKSNEKYVNDVYDVLSKQLTDSASVKTIRLIYNGHYSEYYLNQGKFEKSIYFASIAYKESPENTVTQSLLIDAVVRRASAAIGTSSSLAKLKETCEQFPFLKNSPNVRTILISNYGLMCVSNFIGDREKEGNSFLTLMENELANAGADVDFQKPERIIGYAYAEAGTFYFRKHLYDKALAIMYKGLKVAPDHPELTTRIDIVKKEKEYRKP